MLLSKKILITLFGKLKNLQDNSNFIEPDLSYPDGTKFQWRADLGIIYHLYKMLQETKRKAEDVEVANSNLERKIEFLQKSIGKLNDKVFPPKTGSKLHITTE